MKASNTEKKASIKTKRIIESLKSENKKKTVATCNRPRGYAEYN